MLHKTRGIVIRTLKYSDTSIIAKIYTEKFGIRSYLVRGAKSKKANTKTAQLQPLNLLNMVVYDKGKEGLQTIRESEPAYHFISIPYDVVKSSVLLFINEVLYKSLYEEESNPVLFDYLFDSIMLLDQAGEHYLDFHLLFLIRLSKFLGFYPRNNYTEQNKFFDLQEGIFTSERPVHSNFLDEKTAASLNKGLNADTLTETLFTTSAERYGFLEAMLRFYSLHVPGFGETKSHKVLHDVLT